MIDDGRAAAVVDWDQDGRLDLWVANRTGPRIRFMHNRVRTDNHYVTFLLEGRRCNRDAIGARIELRTGGESPQTLAKTLTAGNGHLSQSGKWLHFGIGKSGTIEQLVVRWPGGQREEFAGAKLDGRYRLIEGTAEAVQLPQRALRPGYSPSTPVVPPITEQARIVLAARPAMPVLNYVDPQGKEHPLIRKEGTPVLINLWASWCAPCLEELADFERRGKALRTAGLSVLALNVEEQDQQTKSAALLSKLGWPFDSGRAPVETLDVLDVLQRSLLDRHRRMPLPTSFLIDGKGRLAVIYKGPIKADDLLSDLTMLDDNAIAIRDHAAALPGRWFLGPTEFDSAHLATRLEEQGFPAIARQYLTTPDQGSTAAGKSEAKLLARIEYNLGVNLAKKGNHAEAIESYRRALAIDAGYVDAHVNLGIELKKLGDTPGAVAEYERAIAIDPNHGIAHHNLAVALFQLGQNDSANEHYAIAQRLRGQPPTVVAARKLTPEQLAQAQSAFDQGIRLHKAGKREEAMAAFGQALEINPRMPRAHDILGAILASSGQLDQAIEHWKSALAIEPRLTSARLNLGLALVQKGNLAKAVEPLQTAIRQGVNSADAHCALGIAFQGLGERDQAIEQYKKARAISPGHAMAGQRLRALQGSK